MTLKSSYQSPGSGEQYCKTPANVRVKLMNIPITELQACAFAAMCGVPDVEIAFYQTKPRHTLGQAMRDKRFIRLQHPSIETFLHELAHIILMHTVGADDKHGPNFGLMLDGLIAKWLAPEWQAALEVLNA